MLKSTKNKIDNCEHCWNPFFNELIDKTPTSMREAVCILCEKCGMFRTKVLEIRYQREIK